MTRTLVCFHAHPDDETISTAGVMARAAAEGHRVVLVVATRGEHGEVPPGFLDEDELLWQRREAETHASAAILGVSRVEFLGYVDSGMIDTHTNEAPESFWQADIDEAALRLAEILLEEKADVLTIYDDHGNYGHPDHIQVHRVGSRAAEIAGTPAVYQATMNRDHFRRMLSAIAGQEGEGGPRLEEIEALGLSEDELTHRVDVTEFIEAKRASMRAHASQISEQSFFLSMPDEIFAMSFGIEWFARHGGPPRTGDWESRLFAD